MGGIAAIVNADGSAIRESEIARVTNILRPYGSYRQNTVVRGNAAFVCCSDNLLPEDIFERQPLVLAGGIILLFDGRVDNRQELGRLVDISPNALERLSDSSIVGKLFERFRERSFRHITGAFCIVAADLQNGEVLCARDQMGMRVLHYYHSNTRFAISTDPEALFALEGIPRILNGTKVADALVDRGLDGETTYFQRINRILPGCLLRVGRSTFAKEQYWNPENIPEVRFASDEEYVEGFKERLHNAVKSMLRSRRPPCATITGGLDSSSIAVIAADILAARGQRLDTFTAIPEPGFEKRETRGRYFDERPLVSQIGNFNQHLVTNFIAPSSGPITQQIEELIRIANAPVAGVLNGLWMLDILKAARSAGHDVMLTGDMGNHTMSFDGWPFLAELIKGGRWLSWAREIAFSGHRWKYLVRHRSIAPFIPERVFRRYKQWRRKGEPPWHEYSAINLGFAHRSNVINRAASEYLPFDVPPPRDGRLHRIRAGFNSYSETADWFSKIRATFNVDLRTPAFDVRLVEFCIGIPPEQYLRRGCDRWLIRRAMKGLLPDAVRKNVKTGVQASDYYARLTRDRTKLQGKLKQLAENPAIASMLDMGKLDSIIQNWPTDRDNLTTCQENALRWTLPQALGAGCFVESVTRSNVPANGRSPPLVLGSRTG